MAHRNLGFIFKVLLVYAFAVTCLNLALIWRVDALNTQLLALTAPKGPEVGRPIPPFAATAHSGETIQVRFGEAEPSRVLVVVRSSCQFSRSSFRFWKRLVGGLNGHPMIGIVTDGLDAAQELTRQYEAPFPLTAVSDQTLADLKISAVPATLLIGSDGTVLYSHVGQVDDLVVDQIQKRLQDEIGPLFHLE